MRFWFALVLVALPYRTDVPAPPPAVPREFRAAWITPIPDLGFKEWPSSLRLSPDAQRAELRALFDAAQSIGLNAIVLHVRVASDALYPTKLAPWSAYISGTPGVGPSPAYDPLAYAVTEAHARGLQLHAWFNPFRAALPGLGGKPAKTHVTKTHPGWIRRYGSQTWIDPGEPAARQFALDAILDVVRRYDVDGVHIDDYFYPYRETRTITRRVRGKRVREKREIAFPDDKTWKAYGKARGFTSRDDWRRANIDAFVQALYKGTKAIKPSMLVGISPFGIWRPGSPRGITGLDAYGEIYADSRKWLAEGWVDYLVPQLYWPLDGTQDRFRVLDAWWRTQNPKGRHIWPGLYTSRVYARRDGWQMSEIASQIATIREGRAGTSAEPGHVHFRLGALLAHEDALGRSLSASVYAERALVPVFPWIAGGTPAPPRVTGGPARVTVTPGDSVDVRWWLVQTRAETGRWTSVLRPAGSRSSTEAFESTGADEVAVSAVTAAGRVSAPAIVGQGASRE